jgi:succinoglycan biosynthesis transport protein ExoP
MQAPYKSTGNEIIVHPKASTLTPARVIYLEPINAGPTQEYDSPGMLEYWQVIRHSLPMIIGLVAAGSLAGMILGFSQTPVYQAKVSVEIQNPNDSLHFKIGDLETDAATPAPESYLSTQAQILKSRTLHERAMARMRRDKALGEPRKVSKSSWRTWLGLSPKESGSAAVVAPADITVNMRDNTRIVEIVCDSTSPDIAASFANALANEYIDSSTEARSQAISHGREFLARQLEEIRASLQNSENQLQSYERTSNLMFTGGNQSVEQDKLKDVETALSTAQADRIQKQSLYQIAASSTANAVPQVIDNPRLSDYQTQLANLRRQLAELTSQFTPEHPRVKQLQAQIDELESTFKRERDNVLTRVRNEYQAALMRESLLNSTYRKQTEIVSDQSQKAVYYNILERGVETNLKLYDSVLQKAKEADIAAAMRGSNVRVIDAALPPGSPYKPNMMWNLLMGCGTGLMAGLAFVLGRESLDRSFKGPGETSFHLKIPELGVIPSRAFASLGGHGSLPPRSASPASSQTKLGPDVVELATWQDKSCVLAESFRSVLTSILHSSENGASPRVILISSAGRGEGKTTVVSNLAIALAEINKQVLMIDADMRKPRLNEVFDLPNNWGLSDLLREKSSLRDSPIEALVQRTEIPNLSILTSGPRTESITNLLYSNRMLELLQRLRSDFDTILIDTPPMLQISDARILGRLVDAAILVFRAGATTRDAALAAKRRLTDDGIPVLGTILNAWDLKSMSRYGYGGYEGYDKPYDSYTSS